MEGRVLVNQIILDKVFETFAKRNPNKKRTVTKLLEDLQYFVEESNDTLKNTYNEKYFDELSIKKVNDALLRGNQKQHGAEKEFRDLLCLYAYDGLDYKTVLIKVLNTSESEEKRLSDRIKLGLSGNEERDIGSFIKNFGISEHSRYAKIDDLYVPPKEYEEIKNTLENERIVFISGTPEFGKTYTAVKLLWEWYKNGYDVEWNQGNDETEREKVRNSFGTKLDSLKSGTIYYYEDPFGKIKYENKSGELELKISQIIRSIQSVSNVFVIITSREDVFDEFKKRSLSKSELEQFEKKLSIISPSYDEHKREEIILKYGDYFKCEWLSSPELKEYVIRKIYFHHHFLYLIFRIFQKMILILSS